MTRPSVILRSATRLVSPLMIVFSVYLLLRGHNEPGGGFIGSLVAATAFGLYTAAYGPAAVRSAIRVDPRRISAAGLVVAILAGLPAALQGAPFLTGVWAYPLGTPLLFDLGVYLVVLGAVLTLILSLEEEEE